VRVSELVQIEVGDVDLEACKIFINRGKGAKDRYLLFPASFRLVLKSHLHAPPRNRYLFETRRFGPFTTRRIQQIVQGYREMAGITQPLHPHLFRHQMLTYLTSKGLTDAQIQLISGHESKKSLEVYQDLSLESVDEAYNRSVAPQSQDDMSRQAVMSWRTPASFSPEQMPQRLGLAPSSEASKFLRAALRGFPTSQNDASISTNQARRCGDHNFTANGGCAGGSSAFR
jgi:hypothetical protein